MKKTRKVTEMGRLITRGEYVANVRANNERIAQVFMAYEERLRKLEALVLPQAKGVEVLALVTDDASEVPA